MFLGFYCFILPKTPPLLSKDTLVSFKDIIGLNALNKLKSKSFFVFFLCVPFGLRKWPTQCYLAPFGESRTEGVRKFLEFVVHFFTFFSKCCIFFQPIFICCTFFCVHFPTANPNQQCSPVRLWGSTCRLS